MNEKLVEYWNETVTKEDSVIHLGDLSLQPRWAEWAIPRLNFKSLTLIMGNHDRPFFKKNQAYLDWVEKYKSWGVTSIERSGGLTLPNMGTILLSHFPFKGEDPSHKNEYERWQFPDDGTSYLLCGHMHSTPETRKRGRMLDVGVDAWNYRPVKLETLLEELLRD